MGVNIGAVTAAVGAGLLAQEFGYSTAFLIAAIGKIGALIALYRWRGRLTGDRAFTNKNILGRTGPAGLSMVSRQATRELMGFAMGMWYMVNALGNYASGLLAEVATQPPGVTAQARTAISQSAFETYALLALITGLLLGLLSLTIVNHRRNPDHRDDNS